MLKTTVRRLPRKGDSEEVSVEGIHYHRLTNFQKRSGDTRSFFLASIEDPSRPDERFPKKVSTSTLSFALLLRLLA